MREGLVLVARRQLAAHTRVDGRCPACDRPVAGRGCWWWADAWGALVAYGVRP
ncbi:hypothetical protein [Polymorphospora sp. NPDC050346]|uniref:hypothetical protein n=1 Tax=Polymorphospora sp. NPDC050346 TaxID=3155780 RepID=UPI0033CB2A06